MNEQLKLHQYRETAEELALRQEAEAFLTYDASLLDDWRLDEWGELFTDDARYMVPSLDAPDADYKDTLFLVSDDYLTLMSRLSQLQKPSAWVENPHSRTRRLITNVRAKFLDNDQYGVTANFAIWRFHLGATDIYVGHYEMILTRSSEGDLKIKERRSILDLEALRPHGRLSIIL